MAERLGMVIDMKGCVACASCAVACKVENNLPDGVWWNRILTDGGDNPDTPAGAYPNLTMENIAVACQHCENPACVKVCPVGATYKDPETGAVRQDYDKCIGCRMCMSACPYTGVRSFNWEEPKHAIGHAMGDADVATHQKHVVEKCTMCSRLAWRYVPDGCASSAISTIPNQRCRAFFANAPISSFCPSAARTPPSTTSFKQKGRMKCLRTLRRRLPPRLLLPDSGARGSTSASSWRRSSPSRGWPSGACSSPAASSKRVCATSTRGASTSLCSCSSWVCRPAA